MVNKLRILGWLYAAATICLSLACLVVAILYHDVSLIIFSAIMLVIVITLFSWVRRTLRPMRLDQQRHCMHPRWAAIWTWICKRWMWDEMEQMLRITARAQSRD